MFGTPRFRVTDVFRKLSEYPTTDSSRFSHPGYEELKIRTSNLTEFVNFLEKTVSDHAPDIIVRTVQDEHAGDGLIYRARIYVLKKVEPALKIDKGRSFGFAIEALKRDLKVARSGWNGKGMWLKLVTRSDYRDQFGVMFDGVLYDYDLQPFIGMKTVDDMFIPWLASQTDMLAEDWEVVE